MREIVQIRNLSLWIFITPLLAINICLIISQNYQILEKDKDKLMERTSARPLPMGHLSITQAVIFSFIIGLVGLFLLNKINPQGSFYGFMSKSSLFGLVSILLYVLSYTPFFVRKHKC